MIHVIARDDNDVYHHRHLPADCVVEASNFDLILLEASLS
jgi:hypothetical protein